MGRDLLISIHPEHLDAMRAGEKTVELRRVRPSIAPGSRVVFYETAPVAAVVAMAVVAEVFQTSPARLWRVVGDRSACTRREFFEYFGGRDIGYAIAFDSLRTLAKPVTRARLQRRLGSFHPPQSYRYLDGARTGDRPLMQLLRLTQSGVAGRIARHR